MTISIRQATFEDQGRDETFILKLHGPHGAHSTGDHWNWLLRNNPLRRGSKPVVWLALNESQEVVGHVCGYNIQIKFGAKIHNAIWTFDIAVLPENRKAGLAQSLFSRIFRENDLSLTTFASPVSHHIIEIESAIPVTYVGIFTRSSHDPLPTGLEQHDLEILPVKRFGKEADELWKRASIKYFAGVVRDSTYLNWKFLDRPGPRYLAFEARKKSEKGKISGYVTLRSSLDPEKNVGLIAEAFAAPDDILTLSALYRFAIEHFRALGKDRILTGATYPSHQQVLSMLGFQGVSKMPVHLYAKDKSLLKEIIKAGESSWFASRAESDWDHFPGGLMVER
jgi:hypothetical protein